MISRPYCSIPSVVQLRAQDCSINAFVIMIAAKRERIHATSLTRICLFSE